MRSLLILVACLGAAALLAVLWVRREPGRVLPPAAAEQGPGASADLLAAGETLAPSAAADQDSGAAERRAVAPEPDLGTAPSCRVRVVLASSGAPAPLARLWIEEDAVDRVAWLAAMQRSNDVEPVLQGGFGRELALDERGEVRVPRPARILALAAALGELHGEARLGPDDAECSVELEAYHALTVLVVDRADRPLEDASVALYWGEWDKHDPWEHQMRWTTDEHGRVWIPKLEGQLWPKGFPGPLRVALAVVPCEPEYASFALDAMPGEPIRLVAGDSGRLVVQVTDAQGADLPLEGTAFLDIDEELRPDLPENLRASQGLTAWIRGGRAVFEHVGLDLSLSLYAHPEDRAGATRWVNGPLAPDEEVLVRIPVGPRAVVARGRVQVTGRILADDVPRRAVLGATAPGGTRAFECWMAEDGAFECPLEREVPPDELAGRWTLDLNGSGSPLLTLGATPTLDEEGVSLDFGDLVFEPPSGLVRVGVLAGGRPIANAQVELGGERRVWCGEEGRCVLDASPAALPIAMRAVHRDWLPSAWTEVREPGGEHVLELRAPAWLEGWLVLPEGGNNKDYEIALRMEPAPAGAGDEPVRLWPREGGRFRFPPCEPGLATLAISYAEIPVLERTGIELRAGETTDLGRIDLRAALQTFELSFALADGEPCREGALVVREPDGASLWLPIGDTGRVRFLSQRPSVDLWAGGPGASAVFVAGATDGQHVILPPPATASLSFPPGLPRPDPPLELIVRGKRLLPETVEWDDLGYRSAHGTAGEDGFARLQAPCAGTYELAWFVLRTDTETEFAVEQAERQTVVVPEPPLEPVIEVLLSPEALARAVAEAGG